MTLQNGLIHRRKAYLWADTGVWDASTGKPIGCASKLVWGLNWPWAASHSGTYPSDQTHRLFRFIGEAAPTNPSELLQAAHDGLQRERMAGMMGRLLVALPCPEFGARLVMIATDEVAGNPPMKPFETVEYMSSGAGSAYHASFGGADFTPKTMRKFIDWQATQAGETVIGHTMHNIAGELHEVSVGAGGVKPRVVKEFSHSLAIG